MKLYYNDPLKAAWMMRQFDIQIVDAPDHGKILTLEEILTIKPYNVPHFYIHPKDYHLFQKKDGAFMSIQNEGAFVKINYMTENSDIISDSCPFFIAMTEE